MISDPEPNIMSEVLWCTNADVGCGALRLTSCARPPGRGAARLAADILRLCGDTLYKWPTVALWADGAPHRLCMADVEFYEEGMDVAEQEGLLLHLAARDEADLRQRLAGLAEVYGHAVARPTASI